ncbi:prolyl oligopeptidase family serine peptidase [Caulobacter sp. 602-1]|uniref:S9 family peptidase n=1 Tax=Caulobacter sp. 602-1 TaxID=2492472 RepID=UPI000F63A028|nr:prolyl oligopeptidase family serine peptidase [Caulobacter sp. 602-1]RRN63916.1 S9 family peptidase [Caulobacter sp. 602-1]
MVALALVAALLVAATAPPDAAASQPATSFDLVTAVLEQPKLSFYTRHDLSADGRWAVYAVALANVAAGTVTTEVRLLDLSAPSAPYRVISAKTNAGAPLWPIARFSPDGLSLAVLDGAVGEVRVVGVADGQARSINVPGAQVRVSDLRWSPDGRKLALLATTPLNPAPLRGGVLVDDNWRKPMGLQRSSATHILVVDSGDGRLLARTSDELSPRDLDWSPDGSAIVLAAVRETDTGPVGGSGWTGQGIYLFDLASQSVRRVNKVVGLDYAASPRFSPDGRRIVFTQPVNGDVYKTGQIVVQDITTGHATTFGAKWERGYSDLAWLDGDRLIAATYEGVGCRLQVISVSAQTLSAVDEGDETACARSPVVGKNGQVLYVRDRFVGASELFLRAAVANPKSAAETWRPRAVTALDRHLGPNVDIRVVSWPSADGAFQIPGVLMTPIGSDGRRPLVISVTGGPSPVNARVMGDTLGQHLNLPMIAKGYAVLLPVTRGRGGYGDRFAAAIRRSGDYMPGPYTDIMGALDYAVKAGIADPKRVGLIGFSYGASLSAYAIGQGDQFKAAVLGDPGVADYLHNAYQKVTGYNLHIARSVSGFGNIYDPGVFQQIKRNSPLTYMSRTRTPAMLQCGVLHVSVEQGCLDLYQGYTHYRIPSQFVVMPRTGHGIAEPTLQADAEHRRLDWLNYWVQREPVPDLVAIYGRRSP